MYSKYTKNLISEVVKNSFSWANVCRLVGVRPACGSQAHLKKRAVDFGIDFSHFTGQSHNKGKTFKGKTFIVTPIQDYLNNIVNIIPFFNSLSYIYFEAVSLALMLNSSDEKTLKLKKHGEFNHLLYVELMHRFKEMRNTKKFQASGFSPTSKELVSLLRKMEFENLVKFESNQILMAIANNIIMYTGTSLYNKKAISGLIFHDFCLSPENKQGLQPKLDYYTSGYIRNYMKFIMQEGGVEEKREILNCIKGRICLNNKTVALI